MLARATRIHTVVVSSSTRFAKQLNLRQGINTQRSFASHSTALNMASGSSVHLEASQQPQYYVKGLTAESAEKTSQLLQVNHEKHHIFFNQSGFHVR
jgi:hypothetical protein